MPLKDMLLCCLSKKGLTTTFELRNYLKEKEEGSTQLSVQGYLQQRKCLNPEVFSYLNCRYLTDVYDLEEINILYGTFLYLNLNILLGITGITIVYLGKNSMDIHYKLIKKISFLCLRKLSVHAMYLI